MIAATDPALRAAEDELAVHRYRDALVASFIHDPTHDRDARIALARLLGLPGPRSETRKETAHGG
jgi:hypothetical protein